MKYFIDLMKIVFIGCLFTVSCEMSTDSESLDGSISLALDSELSEIPSLAAASPEEAIKKCDEIVEMAISHSSLYHAGKAKFYQAYVYDAFLEDVSKAYFGYNEALKFLNQTDDVETKVKALNNLGLLNRFYMHNDAAISSFLTALESEDEIDPKFLSDIYYNLGVTYKRKGDQESFNLAEDAFIQSMEIATEIAYNVNIASVNNQVGMMYKDISNYEMARIAYKNTIRDFENSDKESLTWEFVGKAYHGIGVTYMEEKKYDDAIAAFQKALKFKKSSGSIFITKYDLGSVLYESGQINEAVSTWKDALNEKHNKNDRVQLQIYSKLTNALANQNNFKEAIGYAQIFNEHIGDILSVGETYEAKNNQVLFADIVREYAEFNQVIPFYKEPWAIALMIFFIATAVYAGSHAYYQSKLSTKVSDTRSEIQIEFQNIKID